MQYKFHENNECSVTTHGVFTQFHYAIQAMQTRVKALKLRGYSKNLKKGWVDDGWDIVVEMRSDDDTVTLTIGVDK